MKYIWIHQVNIVLEDRILQDSSLLVYGSKIISVGKRSPVKADKLAISARGSYIAPGFIDSHIHGMPQKIFSNEVKFGTTSIVIAQSCAPEADISNKLKLIREYINNNQLGRNILGVRLEGPYISISKSGAQDKRYIKKPSQDGLKAIIKEYGSILKIVTFAPELKGSRKLIKLMQKNKVIPSIGHSNATYKETIGAIDAGAFHATHVFNAMRSFDIKDPGACWAVLFNDRVWAEIIPDLIHVAPAAIGLFLKAKGPYKSILVTDSVRAEVPAFAAKSGGAYRFANGRLAGSGLTMIKALKNAVAVGGLSLPEGVRLVSLNPAAALGVADKKGSIVAGKDSDLVMFNNNFEVKMTMISGRIVYRNKSFKW